MTSPPPQDPQGPPWARPPQPPRAPQPGAAPAAPSAPDDGRFASPGGAASSSTDAPMLGDEAVARAAEAAAGHSSERIIDTSSGRDDGLNKCPRCGSTEIQYSLTAKALVCSYCRHSWNEDIAEQRFGLDSSIAELRGHTMASGTADVREDLTTVTLKCQGCGAEIVLNVDQQMQARCHWCRQTLSINSQIPNGAVPDAVLPFLLTREEAVERIDAFAGKRKTFALGRFTQEFVPENVMGVYIPYLVVDGNMHAVLRGTGEVTTREYTVRRRVGKDNYVTETYYDADVYAVQRAFDLLVDDLTVESASRFDADENEEATNNILNAVQPYDTENAVTYNSNYLKGFTSERRDLNVRDVDAEVEDKFLAIARAKATPTISRYDRGVRWKEEGVAVHGTRWVSIYVPVWLYSYADSAKGEGALTHYIAVNGRTGTTMGSVPVSHPKIFAASCAAGAVAAVVGALAGLAYMFF
ncbi:TFIIB-type zinc ribbon-containing protein [Brachybacterium paraconglomeratum]|uniref:TFIIB-type zinc ribbon-containing protein n=3 Tax=Brachybacterium TaxID=43668 RepID=A0A921GL03_9MICO|nr:TFIIB-type zinc ribbon-containing protein [Brachybacterium paraconglomeratum]